MNQGHRLLQLLLPLLDALRVFHSKVLHVAAVLHSLLDLLEASLVLVRDVPLEGGHVVLHVLLVVPVQFLNPFVEASVYALQAVGVFLQLLEEGGVGGVLLLLCPGPLFEMVVYLIHRDVDSLVRGSELCFIPVLLERPLQEALDVFEHDEALGGLFS